MKFKKELTPEQREAKRKADREYAQRKRQEKKTGEDLSINKKEVDKIILDDWSVLTEVDYHTVFESDYYWTIFWSEGKSYIQGIFTTKLIDESYKKVSNKNYWHRFNSKLVLDEEISQEEFGNKYYSNNGFIRNDDEVLFNVDLRLNGSWIVLFPTKQDIENGINNDDYSDEE